MKKTSIYLDPALDRALDRRARAQGIAKAELLRRLLADGLGEAIRPKPAGRGVFEGPRDLAAEVGRHLADGGFGEP